MTTMPNWDTNLGSGGYLRPADGIGHLLVVWVLQHVAQAGPTPRQPNGTDAVELDIVKINPQNPAASEIFRTQLWRTGRIIAVLKHAAGTGRPVIGTVYDERPNDQTSRKFRSVAEDPEAVKLANAWYASLGEGGFVPSQPTPPDQIVAQAVRQMTQGQQQRGYDQGGFGGPSQYGGWPQGAMPAQQWQAQQQGGYGQPQQQWGAPQPQGPWGGPQTGQNPQQQWGGQQPQTQPQQPGQWGAPQQQPAQPGGWGAPQQQLAPQQQPGGWGAPQQPAAPQGQWGAQQQQAPQQGQWGAPQQQAQAPQQQGQWGAPPAAGGQPDPWAPQQAPLPVPSAPPAQGQPSMLEMIQNGGQQQPGQPMAPDQGNPPF